MDYSPALFLKRIFGGGEVAKISRANFRRVSGDDPDHYGGPTGLGALCDRASEVSLGPGSEAGGFPLMVPLYLWLDGENFHGKSQSMTLETSMCGLFFQLDLEQDSRSEMMAQLAWQDGFSTEGRNTIGYSRKITWLVLKKNIKLFFVWAEHLTLASLTQSMFHGLESFAGLPAASFGTVAVFVAVRASVGFLLSMWSRAAHSPPWGSWRQGKVRCWRYENTKTQPMNGWR